MNFSEKISAIEQNNLLRIRKIAQSAQSTEMLIDGNKIINFCSNDYLSLADHPQVKEALIDGINRFGAGSGASHLVSGHSEAHRELEELLAEHLGQQRALLFSSGYSANLGVFSALRDDIEWTLQDKLNHASLIDGNRLVGLPVKRYLHNNIDSLKAKLKKRNGKGLVVTDHVFSMDGDQADLDQIDAIIDKPNTLLMQDDAHGFGIFEPNIPNQSIYMATLGKAAGLMGAFVSGEEDFIEFLIQKSRPYIYTTAISPAICVAAVKSLELIKKGEQKEKLFSNINYFRSCADSLKLEFEHSQSAIQPLIVGSSDKALNYSSRLFQAGFFVSAIRPPTVPPNTARLRFTLSANHNFKQIESLLQNVKDVMA